MKSVSCVLSLSLAVIISTTSLAAENCMPVTALNDQHAQYCQAGITRDIANQFATDRDQKQDQWCWAACISMVFAAYGFEINQSEIVRQAYGTIANLPGTPQAILQSLNRSWTDINGRIFSSQATTIREPLERTYSDLVAGRPLIVGSLGHAMVVTSIGVFKTHQGMFLDQVLVRDPYPYNKWAWDNYTKGLRPLSWEEIGNTQCLFHITVRGHATNGSTSNRCIRSCKKQLRDCLDVYNVEFTDCLDYKVERCMDACINEFGFSRHECRSNKCSLNNNNNRARWHDKCEDEAVEDNPDQCHETNQECIDDCNG
ncbi:papain-like cysteine protease family protein [Desulfolutivibrio sulfoxidireducens]|uniref:papain-like cysteine protease family protein n=1 Tax=Desulfolutivibrio sulfoxidireducens TaxID=2773299 RepID=UPI00159D7AA2|nr:papain-like cysteine protease family protein [Desulfolutivibrio sulfoxidireducens]QLA17411.1 hypothetical protein GD605_15620 [Desulfolutivibrio sulfoxidireducens]